MPEHHNEVIQSTEDIQTEASPEKENRSTSWDKYLSSGQQSLKILPNSTQNITPEDKPPEENKQSIWDRFLKEPPVENTSGDISAPDDPDKTTSPYPIAPTPKSAPKKSSDLINEALIKKLDSIENDINKLRDDFKKKILYDAHKDKLIDNLYQELQGYKNDFIKKHLKSMMLDMIKLIDNIRKLSNHYNSQDIAAIDTAKILELLNNIPSDLEDIFYWQNVRSFTSESQLFDPGRQRVLKTVQTQDKEKDKLIAESIRPGYEWDGQVIRPEMVSVYTYKEITNEKEDIRSSDE